VLDKTVNDYKISAVTGEDIPTATSELRSVIDRIYVATGNRLRDDLVMTLLGIFQTTRVPEFNGQFLTLQQLTTADMITNDLGGMTSNMMAENTKEAAALVFNTADQLYIHLVNRRVWYQYIKSQPPSSFTANSDRDSAVVTPVPLPDEWRGRWNCGHPSCSVGRCPLKGDSGAQASIDANHVNFYKTLSRSKKRSDHGNTFKYREPSADECGKRVIDGVPCTYDKDTESS
jgi:hypothetical protein